MRKELFSPEKGNDHVLRTCAMPEKRREVWVILRGEKTNLVKRLLYIGRGRSLISSKKEKGGKLKSP